MKKEELELIEGVGVGETGELTAEQPVIFFPRAIEPDRVAMSWRKKRLLIILYEAIAILGDRQ
ncbi:hypothetical protein [Roseofilum sp. Guam]|uniref:hypothetical protein n=1 Tax=Roseofilum sp. Guam TaxID=2821502 RepID=UPI001B1E6677|nr:hypothetical protein [Roseofilum sp. Guam]MBP0030102.1 hypothetical protein [Roseofilum sp. Guam]